MLETGHLILGVRDFSGKDVPTRSKFGNRSASLIFRLFCGMKISDTQTGLRVFPNSAIPTLAVARGERFEYETNMLLILKPNGIKMSEQVIRTVYIEENKSSHYRTFKDTWRILKIVFRHFGIYIGSSLTSFVVDNSLFYLFMYLITNFVSFIPSSISEGAAVLPARAISSLLNFYLNKKYAFENKDDYSKTIWKYYAVCIPQMAITMVLLPLLSGLIGLKDGSSLNVLLKIAIETILFILSYKIQKNWVFKGQKKK
jgi:putative flippase GtrA